MQRKWEKLQKSVLYFVTEVDLQVETKWGAQTQGLFHRNICVDFLGLTSFMHH